MSLKKQLFLPLLLVFVEGEGRDLILKLDAKEIIDSLTSETSIDDYFKTFADIFAKKAAESFMKVIKNQTRELIKNATAIRSHRPVIKNTQNIYPKKKQTEEILNEKQALVLLREPAPDGDNLGFDSQEFKPNVPVIKRKKVNGIYVRRFLGFTSDSKVYKLNK